MAEVFLAKTTGIAGFEKHVALKVIHPNLGDDTEVVEMLVDEAKLAVQLSHPNIVQTFDLGCVEGTYYLTMEYVDGVDLSQLVIGAVAQRTELPFDACAFVAKDIASALDHAHQRGVIHRDVSPHNVLVSFGGDVKLVDFGIAKAMLGARKTAVGVIKGKYAYMSPEQAQSEPLDGRSDIYSAGMVLYQLLTGRTLHGEGDLDSFVARVRHGAVVAPSKVRAGVPSELEAIAMRALAVRPVDRYQRAGQLALDLQRYLYAASPEFVPATLAALMVRLLRDTGAITVPPSERRQTGDTFRDENSILFKRSPTPSPAHRSGPHVVSRTKPRAESRPKQRAARVGPTAVVEDPSKQIHIELDSDMDPELDEGFDGESKQIMIEPGVSPDSDPVAPPPRQPSSTDASITYVVDEDDEP
jgi:serine/threonine protein kinase